MQFWAPQYEKDYKTTEEHSKECYKDGKGSRAQDVFVAAEIAWFVQPRQEEIEGKPHGNLCFTQKGKQRVRHRSLLSGDSDRTQGNSTKL